MVWQRNVSLIFEHVGERLRGRHRGRMPGHAAPQRLPDGIHQRRHQNAGQSHREKNYLPRPHGAHQRQNPSFLRRRESHHNPAQQVRHPRSDVDAHRINADGRAQLFFRKIIGDQRIRRGRKRRFSHAHAHATEQHLPEVPGQAAQGSEGAPENQAGSDNGSAAARIRQPAQRNPAEGVKHREAETHQDAHLGVGDLQIAAQRPH